MDFAAWADLFDYPHGDVASAVRRCGDPLLASFAQWAQSAAAGEIEEAYCAAFDLSPSSAPYLGLQLCPEPARRGLFLAALAGEYAREGYRPRGELPDHLAVVLRFLARTRDDAGRRVLLRDGVAPALEKMAPALGENPYASLVEALRSRVREEAVA